MDDFVKYGVVACRSCGSTEVVTVRSEIEKEVIKSEEKEVYRRTDYRCTACQAVFSDVYPTK